MVALTKIILSQHWGCNNMSLTQQQINVFKGYKGVVAVSNATGLGIWHAIANMRKR